MIKDIIKGIKLGIKPSLYLNALVGVFVVYKLFSVNIFLALHSLFVYVSFLLMGLLILAYVKNKGLLQ